MTVHGRFGPTIEIQAQHWPDQLDKPRTGSVWTARLGWIGLDRSVRPDRSINRLRKPVCNKRPDRCVNREAVGRIFHEVIYLEVSGSSFMSIEECVSTYVSLYGLVLKELSEHILCRECYYLELSFLCFMLTLSLPCTLCL